MRTLILLALLISSRAQADLVLSVGVGKNVLRQNGTPFERAGVIGYQWDLPRSTFVRPQVGYFSDHSDGGLSSAWGSVLLGVEAHSELGADLSIGVGPAYLQSPDTKLGGHAQVNTEFGVGLSDKNVAVKLVWGHISSGPIYPVNQGRDFVMAQVRILAL